MLGLHPADLPRLMRDGIVTGQHEVRTGDHGGRFRVTFRYGERSLRLTCTEDGQVVSRVRITAAARQ